MVLWVKEGQGIPSLPYLPHAVPLVYNKYIGTPSCGHDEMNAYLHFFFTEPLNVDENLSTYIIGRLWSLSLIEFQIIPWNTSAIRMNKKLCYVSSRVWAGAEIHVDVEKLRSTDFTEPGDSRGRRCEVAFEGRLVRRRPGSSPGTCRGSISSLRWSC